MALPANVSTGIVQGTLTMSDGTAARGTVTFTPGAARLLDAAEDVVVVSKAKGVNLDASGSFSVELVATDDPDLNPVDWTYTVTVNIPGNRYTFSMALPSGATVDLADVTPVVGSVGDAVVVGAQGEVGPQGAGNAPLDPVFGAAFGDYPVVVNTTTATPLHSFTVPAGTLNNNGAALTARFGGTILNNSGSDCTIMFRVPWGDGFGLVAAGPITLNSSANRRKWALDLLATTFFMDGTTGNTHDLEFRGVLHVSTPGSGEWRLANDTYIGSGLTVRSVNVDNLFEVTAQFSVANPAIEIDLRTGLVAVHQASADFGA